MDEDAWQAIRKHTEFYVTDPDTLEPAELETAWRLTYTNDGLYVAVECEQDQDTLVERLSAPDLGFLNRDYVNFVLDTSGEGLYGFWFQLNLGNSRSDGTIQPERQFSSSWNGPWQGKTARTETGWSAEFYIPWSILNMPYVAGEREIGIVMQRKIAHIDERVGFPPLPYTQPKYLSAFQKLILEDVTPRQQLSFFPQVSTTYDAMGGDRNEHVGMDLFWRPSSDLRMAAALHPDFGTVEADDVIINLSAVETFFPEKRLFFLVGQEIFVPTERSGSYSYNTPVMLLHTRRIGQRAMVPDLPDGAHFERTQFRRPTQLHAAAKAMGQQGSVRYGVLTAFEDDTTFGGTLDGEDVQVTQSGRNFGVARALYEESNGNYKGLGFMSTIMDHPTVQASTHGVDGHFFSENGTVKFDAQALVSDIQGVENGFGGFAEMTLAPSRGITHEFVAESFDDKINLNYLGYLPRNNYDQLKYRFRLRKFGMKWFKETSTRLSLGHGWNGDNEVISSGLSMRQEFTFHNQTQIRLSASYNPDTYDDLNSYGNGSFLEEKRMDVGLRYSADSSKRFYYQLSTSVKTESKEGNAHSTGTFFVWRPKDNLALNASLSYRNRDSWLLYRGGRQFTAFSTENWSPRIGVDFFMSSQHHLRMDLQWQALEARENLFYALPEDSKVLAQTTNPNAEKSGDFAISDLNMQLRYRWEIAPMSDLYFVYSKQASLPGAIEYDLGSRLSNTLKHPTSEGLVLKLRYHLSG